uniref:Uncharacterized protein n=1 Tax=Chorda asiatica TaxID=1281577 RepID=A0A8F0JZ41_9PHAE|nr:hypothetical protein V2475_pgp035 [Chorda asiatica]QWK43125.1 hypothetical protein [Chorda asiatica]WAM62244.1 hypothetical protein [Chorda asiatica]
MLCICLNCSLVDRCKTYFLVEQKAVNNTKMVTNILLHPQSTIVTSINSFSKKYLYISEFDLATCSTFEENVGSWLFINKKNLESSSYLLFDPVFI